MEFVRNEEVSQLLESYPQNASDKLKQLRQLIVDSAEANGIKKLVETMRWGEPSYIAKSGSTIRMDWKAKTPNHYYLYFICSTELVNTFRFIFGDELRYEGDRAIILDLHEPLPSEPLQRCIRLALTYHQVKHLHLLGE